MVVEAATGSLVGVARALGDLTVEQVEEKLMEARRTYKLNLGYAGLTVLPAGFVEMVKKFNPHITELELSSNNLSEIPEEFEELRYLRTLRLKYNQIKKLPPVVTRLPQLMVLELSGNQIMAINDTIGTMSLLKELDLSGNMISKLSDAVCSLHKLEVLKLANNRLELLPDEIGDLQSLLKLDVSTNSIRFLPTSMGHFKKIQRIDCGNNLLAKVPPSMGHLKNLKECNLRYNSLDDRYKSKVEEGLSRLLAFLREEEVRERLEEVERLKPIGTPVGAYLEYRCKAEIGQVLKTEGSDITVDNRAWIRNGHSITQVGNMIVIFGGVLVKDPSSATNEIFWMTMDRMEWHNQPCKGDRPLGRYNHCAVYDEDNNRLVVFGGRTAERKRLNDVYFLDLDSFTWYKPNTEGMAPTPREQAVATFWAGHMVLFGGNAIGGRTNDLYLLDLSAWQWSQPATSGTAPSPRQSSGICIGHGNLLFIHGGRNNFVLEDLNVLDFVTKTWTEISFTGRSPPPRHSHIICVHRDQLFLFGGLDELGAQSFSMYRLPLPPGENFVTAKPEWSEWESELPFNKSRTCTFFNGSLSVYQLGSNTLGRVNDEDFQKGLVFFDVYKVAKLDVLKPRFFSEEELKPKNAKRLRVEHTINVASKMPKSFVGWTGLETKSLAYVHDFQRIFEELYPHRRPLYLTPRNECGSQKFICTTLRPTQLNYTELYDLEGCCTFVADFITYEPLEDPLHPPEYLPSPMSTLNWQAGDCFDMATVLCSLLIGVGYNAFVVVGYAPQEVTNNDQAVTKCPIVEKEESDGQNADGSLGTAATSSKHETRGPGSSRKPAAEAGEVKKPKYVIRKNTQLESKFLKEQEAKRVAEGGDKEDAEEGGEGGEANGTMQSMFNAEIPPPGCKLLHAWVLVMTGKRDMHAPIFIEPSSGRRYPLKSSPYLGIEYLWNHRNFWVCMQMALPHSDSRAHPMDVSYDLSDSTKWEAVFDRSCMKSGMYDYGSADAGGDERIGLESRGGTMKSGGLTGMNKPKTPSTALPKASPNTPPTTLTSEPSMSSRRRGTAVNGGGNGTPPRTAESIANGDMGGNDGDGGDGGGTGEVDVIPDIPPSWVPKLSVPRDAFDMRCPRGSKMTFYKCSQHEKFALFGDCGRWDGMVERLVMYEDEERTVVTEIRETFQRRKDKLRERRVYPQKDTTIEEFEGGSAFGLHDILSVKNDRREVNFYHTARLDGLMRREELEGRKLIETFTGRDDRLIFRSATYQVQKSEDNGDDPYEDEATRVRRMRNAKETKKILPIRKMTEKFSRHSKVEADQDVHKRKYYLAENRIHIEHHYGTNRITASSRTYHKDGQSQIVQVDPLADRPQASALLEEYQALLLAEKDCMQAIRDSEWEISEILRTRTNQEQNITLETPYTDIVRIKAEQSEEEEEEEEESNYDYLSPFLPSLSGMQTLSREQALDVREKALKALKDRLIERANIIQARLDEETASLGKRQQNFNRDRDQMTQEEEEEYEKAVEESMFRIHILEKRLKRHEEQALHKYYWLDHKLRSDPRLASLLQGA